MDTILLGSPPVDDAAAVLHDDHRRHHHHHYHSILKDSIDRFLHDSGDLSAFRSIFSRLIDSQPDPPLEILWFYAAVSQPNTSTAATPLDRVLSVRDLLQLLIACSSATHSPAKSIAIVAPVVAKLWQVAVEVVGGGNDTRKAMKEVQSLVEGLMGYIGICGKMEFGFSDVGTLLPCFRDVVRVWTATSPNRTSESATEWLFPLAGDVIRAGFDSGSYGVEDIAGAVAAQVFLMRIMLRLEVGVGGSSVPETTSDLTAWAVGVLTGFGNFKSFEVLTRLLLDSKLPIFPHSNAKHEATLRQILYDSTLLVEYSFLSPLKEVESGDFLRHLALLRLFVFHEAIQLARRSGDHNKAIAYTNAFSRSYIPSKLVPWINNESGISNLTQPNATTPQALIKWLLSLETQGFRVLEGDLIRYREKLQFDERNTTTGEGGMVKAGQVKIKDDELFFLDTKGDGEEAEDAMELTGGAFLSAAQKMKSERSSSNKKRKGEKDKGGKTRTKYVKYKLHDDTIKDYFAAAPTKADVSSGSEVENPISDEDAEEMEE